MTTPLHDAPTGEHPPSQAPEASASTTKPALAKPLPKRKFLKLLGATLGGAGVGQLLRDPPRVQATYTPGTPADVVDTNLTVQGNLIVNLNAGAGTSSPQSRLDVAGEIWSSGKVAIDSNRRAKVCYYAAGPTVSPPASSATGTWGRVKTTTWDVPYAGTWEQLQTMNGSWNQMLSYTWDGLLLSYTWGQVQTL